VVSDEVRRIPQALEMFVQEARAMAALNHPNLVTVFDQGVDGDETFMVMEFIEGRTLERIVEERGRLPVGEALAIADQVCAGLAYAHGRRILHRDIKPANIFLSAGGVVKIGDFGLARAVHRAQLTQTKVCGTPMYMSPEQIRGIGVDFRSDLYSLGCTLFELLTGQPPFVTGEVMYHHMYTPPPAASSVNPALPPEIDQLLASCLEKEMEQRVASAEQLRALLRPLVARFS
jgi:serine/threonine-protein kinase